VFSPHAFGSRRVDVIGVGSTGSRVVIDLAKLGVENIHVWDFDKVEEHNVANQAFGLSHIGRLKTDALAAIVQAETGAVIHTHNERVDGSQLLGNIVFLLTDTMSSRKEIWAGALRFKLSVNLVVETRMGADNGRVYTFNPNKPSHIRAWEQTLYSDEEAEVSACGASVSVGPTAEIISGLAVWQMIRWFSIEQMGEDELDNEIIFSLRPMMLLSRKF
jgi:molybdopterin/thiamine biosynthesis adenylyltransferase